MSDEPLQLILQQSQAKPLSGEHLEVLGKHAASLWVMGKTASLHEAVVSTVRHEQLSPEQVRRVVEFANQDAYLQEFRKEGEHRVVHFDCGPADPGQVLQDLNDGGGGSLYDRGVNTASPTKSAAACGTEATFDKTASAQEPPAVDGLPKLPRPPSLPKLASYEDQLWGLFGTPSVEPTSEPLQPLQSLRQKVAGRLDEATHALSSLELDYHDVCDALYTQVKTAALEGTSLSDVVTAWSTVSQDPTHVKVAFSMLFPRLRADRVLSVKEAGDSLLKQASARADQVDPQHPLVTTYAGYLDVLSKLAAARALQEELAQGLAETDRTIKVAAKGGVVGAVGAGLKATGKGIDAASVPLAHLLVGAKDAKKLAPALAKGTKLTALGGGALAANAALQNVTDRPGAQAVMRTVSSTVPGTQAYQERRYRNMMGQ